MENRRGILIRVKDLHQMALLPREELGELMELLIGHTLYGNEPNEKDVTSLMARALYPYIRDEIDRSEKEYKRKAHAGNLSPGRRSSDTKGAVKQITIEDSGITLYKESD